MSQRSYTLSNVNRHQMLNHISYDLKEWSLDGFRSIEKDFENREELINWSMVNKSGELVLVSNDGQEITRLHWIMS